MRVLFITTESFGGHGGLAKYNRDLLLALSRHPSVAEVVVVPRLAGTVREALPPRLTFVKEGLGGKRRFISALARLAMQRTRFDLVMCGHVNLLPLVLPLALRYRAPIILCVYGIDVWKQPGRASPYTCRAIHGFLSISQITADRFRSWAPLGTKKHWIVPNAIELDRFSPGPKDPTLLDRYGLRDRTVIATLARLEASERMKGVDEVLDVMPRLIRKWPRLSYLVMGDGTDLDRLKQKAQSLSLGDHVVFAGRIREEEKVQHYRLVDAYVMPSRGEGFGFVFLEALACGVPVVASSIDGGREAVRQGALGTLVDPQKPDDILRGIEKALDGARGVVPEGLKYFSFDRFTSRVHSLVDDVMTS